MIRNRLARKLDRALLCRRYDCRHSGQTGPHSIGPPWLYRLHRRAVWLVGDPRTDRRNPA